MNDAGVPLSGTGAALLADTDPDTVLVREYLNGNPHAFETLFKKYQTPVFNLIYRMVSSEDAYDLTQDVFHKVLRSLHTFRGDSKFSTWLYVIARNICLNRIRQISNLRENSLDAIGDDCVQREIADPSPGVDSVVEMHEFQRIVNGVLATLPAEHRLLITLRDFEQLSYEEICEVTGLSKANVKSKLHRARMAFKNRVRPYMGLLETGGGHGML